MIVEQSRRLDAIIAAMVASGRADVAARAIDMQARLWLGR